MTAEYRPAPALPSFARRAPSWLPAARPLLHSECVRSFFDSFYISHKVGHQLLRIHEVVGHLALPDVFVISLAALVVVTDPACAIHHIDQAVFVRMFGGGYRLRHLPDHDFDKA